MTPPTLIFHSYMKKFVHGNYNLVFTQDYVMKPCLCERLWATFHLTLNKLYILLSVKFFGLGPRKSKR